MASKKSKAKAVAAPAPAPSVKPKAPATASSPKEEIAELEKRIAADQARLDQLLHPFVEFPKTVKDRTFASRAEQDAAGPEYADE